MKSVTVGVSTPSTPRSNFGTSRLSLPSTATAVFAPGKDRRPLHAGCIAVRMYGSAVVGDAPAILAGIREGADLQDWRVLVLPSCSDLQATDESDLLARREVLGLITVPPPSGVDLSQASTIPTVVLGGQEGHLLPQSAGLAFPSDTIETALSHLWTLGHRRIVLITSASRSNADREASLFVQWLEAHGVSSTDALVARISPDRGGISVVTTDSIQMAHQVTAWRREYGVTAIICADTATVPVVLTGAGIAGFSVPLDLSIVGMDSESASLARLPAGITCVEVPTRALGRESIRLMAALLSPERRDGVSGKCHPLLTPSRLIIRKTTRRASPSS